MTDHLNEQAYDDHPNDERAQEPRKQASPGFKDAPAQASDQTFRIVGDAGALFAALAAAQGSFLPIHKNRTVTVRPRDKQPYTFDYATLDQVLAACVPALSANGLALLQPFYHGENGLELRTILAHASGARLEAVTELPKVDSVQAAGSALTYLKRYQVQAILGVSSEEDDDGNAADGNTVQNSQPRQPRSTPAAPPAKPAPKAQPAKKPEPAPQKPQEAPAPQEDPPPPAAAESAPEPAPEPPTPLQRKTLGDLMRFPGFKLTGQASKEVAQKLCGKEASQLDSADAQLLIDFLEAAKRIDPPYDAAGLLAYIDEQGLGERAVRAMRAEADVFSGGAS